MEPIKLRLEQMSPIEKDLLARGILPDLQKHFDNPDNRRRFEEWKKEKGKQQFS